MRCLPSRGRPTSGFACCRPPLRSIFPLSAVATVLLVRGREDMWAILCRIAMFIFAASYVAFDTAAGVVTGILVNAAQTSGMPEAWRAPIDAVWTHPVVGGSPLVPAPLLAVLGSVALSVGAIAAAVSLRRAGNSWAPVVLLAISSFGIAIFKTHAWPGGPLTFGGLAAAASNRTRRYRPSISRSSVAAGRLKATAQPGDARPRR